jgi:hypothetical protein
MDIFDAARRALFEHAYGREKGDADTRAALLRRIGVPEEQVAGFCRPGLHAGMILGGAHPLDVQLVVEQVLLRQKAGVVTIRVGHDPYDAAGDLKIEVLEVGPPAAPARDGGPTP